VGIQHTDYGFETASFGGMSTDGQQIDLKVKTINSTTEVFLLARYEFAAYNKLVPYVEGGVFVNKYISTQKTPDNDDPRVVIEDIFHESFGREYNSVGRIGGGVIFHIFPKIGLFHGLGFQQYISSSFDNLPAKVYPRRFDAEVGVRFFPGG
jgi:hypothetical protein